MNLFHKDGALVMPYGGRDVPHAVIEVNQKCNISCAACYKDKMNYTKPLALIKEEIDFVAARRNLHMITLAGGEPTLHPDLAEIIRYIAQKGIVPQTLSNGYELGESLLAECKKAGLSTIFLHVDALQKRGDAPPITGEKDLDPLRQKIAEKITRHGIHCSLEVTAYRQTKSQLLDVIDFLFRTPECRNILVTCYGDHDAVFHQFKRGMILGSDVTNPRPAAQDAAANLDPKVVKNEEIRRMLLERKGMRPYAYVGSSHDPMAMRWMFYYSFIIQQKGGSVLRQLHIDPSFGKLVGMTYRKAKKEGKPYAFGLILSKRRKIAICIVSALWSLKPAQMWRSVQFLWQLRRKDVEIHEKTVTIQEFPSVDASGALEYCRDCPDATVRNGRLVPVCMVDHLSPLTEIS